MYVPLFPVLSAVFICSQASSSSKRDKRSIFPFLVGETILDIQCKRGYLTVCAPDGPDACPIGYLSQTNVGICGFATLNHYLNTTNLAGTCCYKLADSATTTTTSRSVTTATNVLIPQIIAYPVYVQYPYAYSNPATTSSYNYNNNYYATPAPTPAPSYYAAPPSNYPVAPVSYISPPIYGMPTPAPPAPSYNYAPSPPSSYNYAPSPPYSAPSPPSNYNINPYYK